MDEVKTFVFPNIKGIYVTLKSYNKLLESINQTKQTNKQPNMSPSSSESI